MPENGEFLPPTAEEMIAYLEDEVVRLVDERKAERARIRRKLLQEIGPVYVLRLPGTLLEVNAFKVIDTHAAIDRILPDDGEMV
jgi:hypothetical protein